MSPCTKGKVNPNIEEHILHFRDKNETAISNGVHINHSSDKNESMLPLLTIEKEVLFCTVFSPLPTRLLLSPSDGVSDGTLTECIGKALFVFALCTRVIRKEIKKWCQTH